MSKVSSASATIATSSSLMRQYAAQSRTHVLRSTSISPLVLRKQRQTSFNPKPLLPRPQIRSTENQLEKKSNSQSRLAQRELNSKSQLLTHRKQLISHTPSTGRSTSFQLPKVRFKNSTNPPSNLHHFLGMSIE